VGIVAAASLAGCAADTTSADTDSVKSVAQAVSPPVATFPSTYARQWMVNAQLTVQGDDVTPAVAARTYAYYAIAIYESLVHGMPGYRSLAGQLNGLESLPTPDPAKSYDWPTVLATVMPRVALGDFAPGATPKGVYVFPLRLFFEYTTTSQASMQSLAATQLALRQAVVAPDIIDNSVAYGTQLGDAIREWANADGFYAIQYKGYVNPTCPSCYTQTGFSDADKVALPLDPHFGEVRPLVMDAPNECDPGPPIPFSTDPSSDMYAQAMAVVNTDATLTVDQRDIARHWADVPGDSSTPAGHWVAIMHKFVRPGSLAQAAAGYILTSIGFMDSFIGCWEGKYHYDLMRPETYIRSFVAGESEWRSLWPAPHFPSYTSGHSSQSGASGVLMTATFGSGPFIDDTKLRRGMAARSFANFTAAADEAGVSRIYGGIHFPMDNNNGLALGHCVGNKVLSKVHLTL
jgi:hypothetical protein